jgi:2-oxoglutarate ferredoxin oxidoreductase subunit alpha
MNSGARVMMRGNEAVAEAALRAGMDFYAGYPITPQNDIPEYLSRRMPELGRRFIQSQSELAGIYMVYGAAAGGMRAMTSSAGVGMSLMQEGISFMTAARFPCLLVNVQRWGHGMGSLQSAQTDYLRDTRGGGNGDYRIIVFGPNSVQEMVDLAYQAFDIAESYRLPVEILSEAALGQMMEPCILPDYKQRLQPLDWIFDGTGKNAARRDRVFGECREDRLRETLAVIEQNEQRWEAHLTDDAEYVFVSFGIPSRVTKDLVTRLRETGERVGLIRPISLWPFPVKAFAELPETVKAFIAVESTDRGELVEDVALASKRTRCRPVYLCASRTTPTIAAIREVFDRVKRGDPMEVF